MDHYSFAIPRELKFLPEISIDGKDLNKIRYADVSVLKADTVREPETILEKVGKEKTMKCLTINYRKTESMVFCKETIQYAIYEPVYFK